MEIPLSRLIVDYSWNARTGVDKLKLKKEGEEAAEGETGGETEENEFSNLCDSLEAIGQTDPIDVLDKDPKTQKPYPGDKLFVVAGFRRFRAIQALAEKHGNKEPKIKVIVKEMTPLEARVRNLSENLARRKLSVPDACKNLVELKELMLAEKKEFTHLELAKMIGVGRPYVTRMFAVEEKVTPAVLKKWHNSSVEVPFERMEEIARKPKEEQEKAFAEIAKAPAKEKSGPKQAIERACAKATRIGDILGRVARLELFAKTKNFSWKNYVVDVVGIKLPNDKEPTENQIQQVADALTKAYKEALEGPQKKEEKKEEEDDEAAE